MKQKAHYLHIPKTGGTALKAALREHRTAGKYELVLHGHKTKVRDIPQGEKFFFCLRDPVSRFVSAFYSRQRNGRPRYNGDWGHLERKFFSVFKTPNEFAHAFADDQAEHHDLATRALQRNGHFKTYFKWFESFEYFQARQSDILYIGYQETLSESFEQLKTILELPPSISLPRDDVEAHRNPVGLDKSLDNECVEALRRWYQSDFDLIEYTEGMTIIG